MAAVVHKGQRRWQVGAIWSAERGLPAPGTGWGQWRQGARRETVQAASSARTGSLTGQGKRGRNTDMLGPCYPQITRVTKDSQLQRSPAVFTGDTLCRSSVIKYTIVHLLMWTHFEHWSQLFASPSKFTVFSLANVLCYWNIQLVIAGVGLLVSSINTKMNTFNMRAFTNILKIYRG